MKIAALAPIVVMAIGVANAAAQQPGAPPCRVPAQERLAFLPGEWRVELNTRLGAKGPWEKAEGVARAATEVAGCVIVERLTTRRSGRPMEAMSVIAFDHQNERWQLAWHDSEHGASIFYEGRATPDGIDFRHERQAGELRIVLRRLFTFSGDRAFTWSSARSLDGGRTWDTTATATYSKR